MGLPCHRYVADIIGPGRLSNHCCTVDAITAVMEVVCDVPTPRQIRATPSAGSELSSKIWALLDRRFYLGYLV